MGDQEPKRKRPPRSNKLNIMIVKGLGEVRNFNVSSRLLFWAFLFFIAYIVASLFVINDYLDKYWDGLSQAERMSALQQELDHAKKALSLSRQRLALLEGYEERPDSGGSPAAAGATDSKEAHPAGDQNPLQKKDGEASEKPLVEVRDLEAVQEGAKFKVQFKIFNLREGDLEPLKGYVHSIAVDGSADPPRFFTYPREELQEGVPKDYKSGERFVIKNFRTIRGEYPLSSSPSSLKVLIYDEDGSLLLEEAYDTES